jgi:hypothetical protein
MIVLMYWTSFGVLTILVAMIYRVKLYYIQKALLQEEYNLKILSKKNENQGINEDSNEEIRHQEEFVEEPGGGSFLQYEEYQIDTFAMEKKEGQEKGLIEENKGEKIDINKSMMVDGSKGQMLKRRNRLRAFTDNVYEMMEEENEDISESVSIEKSDKFKITLIPTNLESVTLLLGKQLNTNVTANTSFL